MSHCNYFQVHIDHQMNLVNLYSLNLHQCTNMKKAMDRGFIFMAFPPQDLVVNHYVEAFSWDKGRCKDMWHKTPPKDSKKTGGLVKDADFHCEHQDTGLL